MNHLKIKIKIKTKYKIMIRCKILKYMQFNLIYKIHKSFSKLTIQTKTRKMMNINRIQLHIR